jgi:hypothetical protein
LAAVGALAGCQPTGRRGSIRRKHSEKTRSRPPARVRAAPL